jgi:uncharacterized membrane protein
MCNFAVMKRALTQSSPRRNKAMRVTNRLNQQFICMKFVFLLLIAMLPLAHISDLFI